MDFTGKVMKCFPFISPEGFDSDQDLDLLIEKASELRLFNINQTSEFNTFYSLNNLVFIEYIGHSPIALGCLLAILGLLLLDNKLRQRLMYK